MVGDNGDKKRVTGNTDGNAQRENQYVYWCFTVFDLETMETMETILKGECNWYVMQLEVSPSTGKNHWQGTLKLKDRKRLGQMKQIDPSAHWEPTRAVRDAIRYCQKLETYAGEYRVFGIDLPPRVKIPEIYGWQKMILLSILKDIDNIRLTQEDRKIYWLYEEIGCFGKSIFVKYLILKHNAMSITGSNADIGYMLKDYRGDIVIYDIPRTKIDFVNYTMLECVKNGVFHSTKYESKMIVRTPPVLICFANEEPKYDKLSKDRWYVINLRNLKTDN